MKSNILNQKILLTYDELVNTYEVNHDNLSYIYIKRAENAHKHLVVLFATHNAQGKYPALETMYKYLDVDLLFFCDNKNSYYHNDDSGALYLSVISDILKSYLPDRIVFFGSSMAGYMAIRCALHFNSNCLVNNPQINLDASMSLAWPELANNIKKIPNKLNLDEFKWIHNKAMITVLHGNHKMDLMNIERLYKIAFESIGVSIFSIHCDENSHQYNIKNFQNFRELIFLTLQLRESSDRLA